MARGRFVASFYSNCAECEEVIEPGDDAGFVGTVDGAVCEECLDYLEDEDGFERDLDDAGHFGDWRDR